MSDHLPVKPFRKHVPLVVGIVWNTPVALMTILACTGFITPATWEYLIVGWMTIIPLFAVLLAISPRFQRLLLKPSADIARLRRSAWGLAGLWIAILAVWLGTFILTGHGSLESWRPPTAENFLPPNSN